jgi:hypothetical protein
MLVSAGMEVYDGHVVSGAGVLVVAFGLGALAVLLTRRYG